MLQTLVVLLPRYSGIIIIIDISVAVTSVTIIPAGDNNVVYFTEGEIWTVTCAADFGGPAAWIQWYNY